MKKSKYLVIGLGLFSLLSGALISCNGGNNTSLASSSPSTSTSLSSQETVILESVQLQGEKTTVKVGDTITLNYVCTPSNYVPKSVVYKAVNSEIIQVNNSGEVRGLKVGTSDVELTIDNKTSLLTITVVPEGAYSYLDIEDYASALEEDPYTKQGLTGQEDYGLSEGDNVGVNQEGITERFPKLDDSNFQQDRIINVSSLTLEEIKTYIPEATEINNYYSFQAALLKAQALSNDTDKIKIKLPQGEFKVSTAYGQSDKVFVISDLKNVYIEGNNTNFILSSDDLTWKGLMKITSSTNVYINDISLDYSLPPSLTGAVTKVDEETNKITLSIDPSYDNLVQALLNKNPSLRSYVEFDQNTKAPLQNGNFVVDNFSSYQIKGEKSNYTIEVTFKSSISRPKNNSLASLQFTQYDASGMVVSSSSNIYIEDLTMYHTPGMAFTANNTTDFYLNRFNLCLKEGSKDLMTATADGLHLVEMHGNVQVTNSLIENSHDDALNIKQGYWYKLSDGEGGSTKSMTLTKLTGACEQVKVGDKIAVYNEETFESYNPSQGYYTVASIEEQNSTSVTFTVNERMSNFASWGTARATFISNTPSFVFKNNIVRNKRNRGVLVQVPNALVENNAFINVGHGSIQAASAIDQYNEATLPQNLTVRNNKFINNCYLTPEPLYGDISLFAIGNNGTVGPATTLTNANIENNYIAKNGNAAISMRGVSSSNIKDNLFYECSRSQPNGEGFNCLCNFYNADDINITSNYNYYTLDRGLSGIILNGKTSQTNINLGDDNHDISFQQLTEVGPSENIAKATSSINVDGKLDEWTNNGNSINFNGYSYATGTEASAAEVADHFKINSFKMTHDEEGIYLGFDIFDNKLDFKTINDFWLGDCIELLATTITNMPGADLMVYKEDGGVLQAAFTPRWENGVTIASARSNSKYLGHESDIKTAYTTTDTSYVGEVKLPFTLFPEFKAAIDEGKAINMAIVVADAERNDLGLKRLQVGNVPHFVETYKTKSLLMTQYTFTK